MNQLELSSTDDLVSELRKRGFATCGAIFTKDGETKMSGYDCNVLVWDVGDPVDRIRTAMFILEYVIGKVTNEDELTEEQIQEIINPARDSESED